VSKPSMSDAIENATVMVTGGCGFIGSHLVRRLVALGAARIVVIDSLRYGDQANLGDLGGRVELVEHTLGRDPVAALREKMRDVRLLFHLAAEKHNQSKDDPLEVLRSNVDGSFLLFDAAARCGVEKVVFSSSLYAYGRMRGGPFVEDERPEPCTVYGISKLTGEHLLRYFHAQHGLTHVVLRYLFVYGPRQFAGMGYKSVIVKNFERLLHNEAPIVYGDGNQTLDYVYVDDVVEATIAAMAGTVSGEVINVGSGMPTTVADLVDLMRLVAARPLPIRHEPPDWTAGSRRVGNVDKARRLLGWEPRIGLREGLEKTYRWMREEEARGAG
jgi:UDP-glucose 4-epimerase